MDREAEFHEHDDVIYPSATPFILVHLACLGAIWTGVSTQALLLCLCLYLVRMFGVTVGYHRYFSHKSFQTSRAFQFLLAFLAQTSAQKGVIWWASKHRDHHRHSDTEDDSHSPVRSSFFFAHIGWVYATKSGKADLKNVKDLTRFPELVWLDKHIHLPAFLLALACFALGGWQALVVGFFWSTILLYHCTFAINSVAHVWGSKRYFTGDNSRNNWLLALVTLGEGWHNNHHYYMASARQGFRWYEIDPNFWVLVLLEKLGIIWNLRRPPKEAVLGERRLNRAMVQRAIQTLRNQLSGQRLTLHELEERARKLVGNSPSVTDIVEPLRAEFVGN